MKVTIRGPDDALLVDEVVPAEGFHWMPPMGGDGIYRFQAYILTEHLERNEIYDTPVRAPRVHGTFEVRDGYMVVPRDATGPNDDLSAVPQAPGWLESLVGRGLAKLVPDAAAANLEASSVVPTVSFDDTGNSDQTYEWNLSAYDPFDSTADSEFSLYDDVNNGYVLRITESTNNSQTLVVDTNGDIALANGGFLFDRNGGNFPRLGIGSTVPSEEIHITSSTPGIRFEDSSDASQVDFQYDFARLTILGNGGQHIVALDAKAPQDALFVDGGGDIGLGTNAPMTPIHVERSDGSAGVLVQETSPTTAARELFKLSNNGGPFFVFENTDIAQSYAFAMGATGHFLLSHQQTSGVQMRLTPAGNLTISGSLSEGSSREIKDGITPVDPDTVLAKLDALPVSEWSYQAVPGSRHVGPMAEDFHATFGLGPDERHIAPRDLAGVALAAAKALRQKTTDLEAENESLRAELAALRETVEAMRGTELP